MNQIESNIPLTDNIKGINKYLKRFHESKYFLILFLPCFAYYIIFKYVPMWGLLITFKNYKVFKGFFGSSWVGLYNYVHMFQSPDFKNLFMNTFLLGLFCLICEFPIPILFALIINEVKNIHLKKLVQTVSYMPYFISIVIVVGMLNMFLNPRNGVINNAIAFLGYEKINFLLEPSWFRALYILSDIWQYTGWGAIIYIAALSGIDIQLYESAIMDGAGKWKQLLYITLPGIMPVIIITLILNTGTIVDVGFEKVFLMQKPATYSTADVIATYVYRQGVLSGNISAGATFGAFNSVVNLFFILISNRVAGKYSETSLW